MVGVCHTSSLVDTSYRRLNLIRLLGIFGVFHVLTRHADRYYEVNVFLAGPVGVGLVGYLLKGRLSDNRLGAI